MVFGQERSQLENEPISHSQKHSRHHIRQHCPRCKNGIQLALKDSYINQVVQIARTEVSQHCLHQSQRFVELDFSLFPHISLALHEPLMEVVTGLEKYDDADQQEEEDVIEHQLRMVLQGLKAVNAEVNEVGEDKQQVGDMVDKRHYKITADTSGGFGFDGCYCEMMAGLFFYKSMNSASKFSESERKQQVVPYCSDKMVKILLIGNSGVGKSSILLQYSDKKFAHNYYNTIGVDYRIKYVTVRGKSIKLQIWDTAGQDRFKTITSSYYRGADGIIVVYDITDRTSFDNVKVWLAEIEKYVDEHTVKFIVGNKNDLEEKRQVSEEEAYQFTQQLGTPFRETSARLATNIDTLFEEMTEKILFDNGKPLESSTGPVGESGVGEQQRGGENIRKLMEQQKKKGDGQSGCCSIY